MLLKQKSYDRHHRVDQILLCVSREQTSVYAVRVNWRQAGWCTGTGLSTHASVPTTEHTGYEHRAQLVLDEVVRKQREVHVL